MSTDHAGRFLSPLKIRWPLASGLASAVSPSRSLFAERSTWIDVTGKQVEESLSLLLEMSQREIVGFTQLAFCGKKKINALIPEFLNFARDSAKSGNCVTLFWDLGSDDSTHPQQPNIYFFELLFFVRMRGSSREKEHSLSNRSAGH